MMDGGWWMVGGGWVGAVQARSRAPVPRKGSFVCDVDAGANALSN